MHKKGKKVEEDPSYKLVSSPESKSNKNPGKIKKLKMKNIVEEFTHYEKEKVSFEN